VTALDGEHFRETAGLLAAYADAQRKTLLTGRMPWTLTVILPTAEDYRDLAPGENVTGFYRADDRTLISVDRGRVLLHEFTHALHHADAAAGGQNHPIWIREGIATLFESCELGPDGLRPLVDLRLTALQAAARKGELIPLDRLVRMTPKTFGEQPELAYAESRYVLLCLHQRGKLRSWYETYKRDHARDATGREALERAMGEPLAAFERNWKAWLDELELPWGELRSAEGRLGAEVKNDSRGVKVVGLVAGGAAERAGRLAIGDVIYSLDGRAVSNGVEFAAAVRAAGAMQTVTVELLRGGRRLTVRQPLGAPGGTTVR
jgi:hypothetical protein